MAISSSKILEILKDNEEKVKEYLEQAEREHVGKNYQEDIYMYIDDNENIDFDTFMNVGGNSWLDDDHITIHRFNPDNSDLYDFFNSKKDIVDFMDYLEMIDDDNKKHLLELIDKDEEEGTEEFKEYFDENEEVTKKIIEEAFKDAGPDSINAMFDSILEDFEQSAREEEYEI